MEVNTCDVINLIWSSQIVLHYCNLIPYKQAYTLILSTTALVMTLPLPAYSSILPKK